MSEIFETCRELLNMDLPCDETYEKLKKLSKYKIDENFNEEMLNNLFFTFISDNFLPEEISFCMDNNLEELEWKNENIFKISHYILSHHQKNVQKEEHMKYKQMELFYQTFFFYELDKENEANHFTFYQQFPEKIVEQNKYETYLLNIGKAILGKDCYSNLLNILFSEETPEFLRNIILVCFVLLRVATRDVNDFISFCVPCLNHYNLYYLCQAIKKDFNVQFNQICEINYHKLEQILSEPLNNIIDDKIEEDYICLNTQTNETKIVDVSEEEMSKYFSFPNINDESNISLFFTSDNLKKNGANFRKMIVPNKIKDGNQYSINYDNLQINAKIVNAFSFVFLLKYKKINKIDQHFFQIFNHGNIQIKLFSFLLLKYIDSINGLLDKSINNKQKEDLFRNSGFYKLNNEYVLLINVNEEDEKLFFLKCNLGKASIISQNNDESYKIYQITLSNHSSIKMNSEIDDVYIYNTEEKTLYNFGNYSFENDIRTFFKNFLKHYQNVYELPRLFFLLNYAIPTSQNVYQFITNVKSQINPNSSYGYAEIDFVLKNETNEDIIINSEFLPYKEKIFMTFPNKIIYTNNKKIILKNNSIIFFEFKTSFPQYDWKNKFNHLLRKIGRFLDIYRARGLYNKEYIQIYFIYDSIPDIYFIKEIKSFMNNHKSASFSNYEFGIYYFTRGINLINNQTIEKNILDIKCELSENRKLIKDLFSLIENDASDDKKKKLGELKLKYNFDK